MEIIRKYKIQFLLIVLIILVLILGLTIKNLGNFYVLNNGGEALLTLTPKPDPFLHAESLNLPSSYMGYTFTKLASESGALGKNALYLGNKGYNLEGTEWVVKKNNVSDAEAAQFGKDFTSFAEVQLSRLGWVKEGEHKGAKVAPVAANGPTGSVWGYLKTDNGKIQVMILKSDKGKPTCPCNIEFRVFLSNVENLDSF